jgi:regulator of sigma E protease
MLLTIVIFVLVLGLVVIVHELGHFIAAKRAGLTVDEFGIGFPPKLWSFKRGKTEYSINLIPIGGFVRIKGVVGDEKDEKRYKDKDSFTSKPFWIKSIILSAGVLMNLVLAWFLLGIGYTVGLPTAIDETNEAQASNVHVQIIQTVQESAAEQSGLHIGDMILAVNGQDVTDVEQVREFNLAAPSDQVQFEIKRGKEIFTQEINLATMDGEERLLGVVLAKTGIIKYPWYESIWLGLKQTVILVGVICVAFYRLLADLIVTGTVAPEIAGPVGIAVVTGQVAELGFIYLLQFTAVLSINLAILNFFPFPALDGGRLIFAVVEKFRGKPVSRRVEAIIHNIGFTLLILVLLLVTIRDISKIFDPIRRLFIN